jgi:hypothetical protein
MNGSEKCTSRIHAFRKDYKNQPDNDHDDCGGGDDDDDDVDDNSIQFFIICVSSQQLQGQLQTQHSVYKQIQL